MEINQYKVKLNTFTAELPEPLDETKRTYILTETDIYAVESRDCQDGTHDVIYKCKVVGSTEVKQGDRKIISKSKRTNSQKLRQAVWSINESEEYYDWFMNKLIVNLEEVIDFLKDK